MELFWDSEVVNVLVDGTNLYAKKKGAVERSSGEVAVGRQRPWGWPWKKMTESEINIFLGLLHYMEVRREGRSSGF